MISDMYICAVDRLGNILQISIEYWTMFGPYDPVYDSDTKESSVGLCTHTTDLAGNVGNN
jgi:hypothetical protein